MEYRQLHICNSCPSRLPATLVAGPVFRASSAVAPWRYAPHGSTARMASTGSNSAVPRKVDATSLASAPRSGRLLDRRGAFFDNHYHVEGAEPSDLHAQDVGNVVLLEHINLEVPDLEVARLFYGEGLGLAADPSTSGAQRGGSHVVWYNCGRQQFHIARGPEAQRLPAGAVVGLVMPDVAAVAERVEAVRQLLGDVTLTYARGDTLEVADPYGNTFAVHASLPHYPVKHGIAYVQLPCFPGTARHIAAFYARRMGARVRLSGASAGAGGGAGGTAAGAGHARGDSSPARAEVVMGPGQQLVFVEQAHLGEASEEAVSRLFTGWHVAMYVADFSRCYGAVHADQPPFNDHPYRDKYHSLSDALGNHQFRFQDITADDLDGDGDSSANGQAAGEAGGGAGADGKSGAAAAPPPPLVYRLSHEVRSLHHPLFARALYNRGLGFV